MNETAATPSPDASSPVKLVGVGGWLLLLIVKLWAGVALRLLVGITELNHHAGLLNIGLAALAAIAAYLLGTRNPKGVLFAKIFLIVESVYYVLELLSASSDNPPKTAGFLIAAILYFLYLLRSKRVKNTYFSNLLPQPVRPAQTVEPASPTTVIVGEEKVQMTKPLTWKNWLFVILTGLLAAGGIAGGQAFVMPDSAQAVGGDTFSLLIWGLFLWSLSPFIRKGITMMRGGS